MVLPAVIIHLSGLSTVSFEDYDKIVRDCGATLRTMHSDYARYSELYEDMQPRRALPCWRRHVDEAREYSRVPQVDSLHITILEY